MNYFAYFDIYFGIALFAWEVSGYSVGGVWVSSSSLHTHIVHIMSEALYPGLCNLELEGIV